MDSNATRTLKPEITLTGSESKMKSFKPTKSLPNKMNTDKRSQLGSTDPIKLANQLMLKGEVHHLINTAAQRRSNGAGAVYRRWSRQIHLEKSRKYFLKKP